MKNLIELYQKYCPYPIIDPIQSLDFQFDINQLRTEIFKFIANNNFGMNGVSLRLPDGKNDYIAYDESIVTTGVYSYDYIFFETLRALPRNSTSERMYTNWHPNLKDSYISELVPELEKLCGFNIGRIRLAWLKPDSAYRMHIDFEPLRIHIPLITNNAAYFIENQKIFHMEYGKLYHLITTASHTACNFGNLPRLHLILSTTGDDKIEQEIDQLKNTDNIKQQFIEHTSKGIDKNALEFLFKIYNSQSDEIPKDELLFKIKAIKGLLNI